jgi:5-methyltetrahydrofolate--homocysteine methyltransferase
MKEDRFDVLVGHLLDGDQANAVAEARGLIETGVSRNTIIKNGIEEAMARLDAKCTIDQFNLLEIMLCGRAVTGVMQAIYPPGLDLPEPKAVVTLGSLEGDVHDLGKNIVKLVLTSSGYRVVDCGKNCPLDRMLDQAENASAFAVGVSGLITTIVPQVRLVRDRMRERGLEHMLLFAGGAALSQASPLELNVDYVARNAFDGLHYLDRALGGGS